MLSLKLKKSRVMNIWVSRSSCVRVHWMHKLWKCEAAALRFALHLTTLTYLTFLILPSLFFISLSRVVPPVLPCFTEWNACAQSKCVSYQFQPHSSCISAAQKLFIPIEKQFIFPSDRTNSPENPEGHLFPFSSSLHDPALQ